MAYIHPADILRPFLEPVMGSATRGITQGVQLGTLGADISKQRMMKPYYEAEAQAKIQEIADKKAKEARFQALMSKFTRPPQVETMLPPGTRIPEKAAAEGMTTRTVSPQYAPEDMLTLEMLGLTNLLPKKTINEPTGQEITSGLLVSPSAVPISGYTLPQNYHLVPTMVDGVPTEVPMMFDARGRLVPITGQAGTPKWQPKEQYGPQVVGPGGSILQQNLATGKWESVVGRKGEGAAGDSMAKIGNINAVNREMASKFLSLAKANLGNAEANQLIQGLFTTDQFGGSVNDARLRDALNETQRESYDWIKMQAQANAAMMAPARAVDEALKAHKRIFPTLYKAAGRAAAVPITPPAGFIDSGRTSGGKRVYIKGEQAWVAP